MKMNRKRARVGIAAFVMAALSVVAAPPARADTIELNNWWGGHGTAQIDLIGGVNYHNGTTTTLHESGGAGGFKTYDLTTDLSRLNSFQSWCVDIFHGFSFPISRTDTLMTAASIFGTAKATDLGRLYTNHHSLIDGTGSSASNAVAFQLAVWEIVNEDASNPYSLTLGEFRASSTTGTSSTIATTWLNELNNTPSTSLYNVNIWSVQGQGPSGSGAQDVAIFAPVPEPEIYAMMGIGLGLMGWVARRRKQQAA